MMHNRPSTPLVSVIVNCFNGEKFLDAAIDSVLLQTYENWELIFWDNQSTDKSAEIFLRYTDRRLKYFRADSHTLLYAARNSAIANSNGELIAFLDVDDWWAPDKLERQVPQFENEKVGFACSNYWIVNLLNHTDKLFRNRPIPHGFVINDILADYPVGMLTLVIRRSAFNGLKGGCDERLHVTGDRDLAVKLSLDWEMASIQEPLAWYRIHGENEGPKQRVRQLDEYRFWTKELESVPIIRNTPGFGVLINEYKYMEGLQLIVQRRLFDAFKLVKNMPLGVYKLKLFAHLLRSFAYRPD